jgi:hypothetical protein
VGTANRTFTVDELLAALQGAARIDDERPANVFRTEEIAELTKWNKKKVVDVLKRLIATGEVTLVQMPWTNMIGVTMPCHKMYRFNGIAGKKQ